MGRKVTTEYTCDRCTDRVKTAKELQRFSVQKVNRGRKMNESVMSDLCKGCESELLAALETFFAGDQLPELHSMSREEE